jgi:hypothetical protein
MRPVKEADIKKLYPELARRQKKGQKPVELAQWLYVTYGLTEPDGQPLSAKRLQQMMHRAGGGQTATGGGRPARASRQPAPTRKKATSPSDGPGWGMYVLGIVGLVIAVGLLIALQQIG